MQAHRLSLTYTLDIIETTLTVLVGIAAALPLMLGLTTIFVIMLSAAVVQSLLTSRSAQTEDDQDGSSL